MGLHFDCNNSGIIICPAAIFNIFARRAEENGDAEALAAMQNAIKFAENIDISDDTSPPAPNAVVGNVNPIPSSPGYNNAATSEGTIEKTSVDNIDIPAFLRQQAD